MRYISSRQNGQVLLLVVIAMTLALTVGLSLASRTISNLKISKQNEESQRAFQAAEAGIENAIKNLSTTQINGTFDVSGGGSGANYVTTVDSSTSKGTSFVLNNGNTVTQDIGMDVWLSTYSQTPAANYASPYTGTVTIHWGSTSQTSCNGTGASIKPALEVMIISANPDVKNPKITKYLFDQCGTARTGGVTSSDVSTTPVTIQNTTFNNTVSIAVVSGFIGRVIPLYNSSVVATESTGIGLPQQGSVVTSTGQSGDSVRKITFFAPYPQLPLEVFSYAILSQ